MDIIVFAIFGFITGFIIVKISNAVNAARENKRNAIVKYLNSIIHQVNIERHQGIEYWFDEDNDKFLGQGNTFDDVVSVLKSRFPDHVFLLKDTGAICAKSNWQVMPFDELKNINFLSEGEK